jgi:hypothetical protein
MALKTSQVGRLAFRVEGVMWNCYWAFPGTMKGALYLGSIHMNIAKVPEYKDAFMKIMKDSLQTVLNEAGLGVVDAWEEQTAPEHERTRG